MPLISLPVGRGAASGIDPSLTDQLQEAAGVIYKVGDPAAHKFPGRTLFNNTPVSANPVFDVVSDGANVIAGAATQAYTASANAAPFSSLWTFPSTPTYMDITSMENIDYVVTGIPTANTTVSDTAFGAFAIPPTGTPYRIGLAPVDFMPVPTNIAGTIDAGTYWYWVTEYDDVHLLESATTSARARILNGAEGARITFPTQRNASATKFRLYRSIAGGDFPIGWLVTEVTVATATYDDTALEDATLVLSDPYRIVSPSDIPESMDLDIQDLSIQSIATFEGSLVGVSADGYVAWTPAGEPHSWPESYRMNMPTLLGGGEKCVRKCGDGCYVATQNETFRMNYLPDENDAVFSTGVAVEHVANYGTPSPRGMCNFTAWGGAPVLFVASLQGPILIAGTVVDRAVANLDWASTVNLSLLSSCKAVDNPDDYRVELYYLIDDSPHTWRCLHFYYDSERTERTQGPLPEMAWTGPHLVPGPGCYAVATAGPVKFTAGDVDSTGSVWKENDGTVDSALLTDSDGTIPFTLRTRRTYASPMDTEARADRVYIHSREQNDGQDYDVTFTAYRENGQSTAYPNITIPASGNGMVSHTLNASHVSLDVTVNADGVSGMAPINNIHIRVEDVAKALKTQVT